MQSRLKKLMIWLTGIILGIILLIGIGLYFGQEKLIFFPHKLSKDYVFQFGPHTEEITIDAEDGAQLHGLLFKTPEPKGLIFFLHGNGSSVAHWGEIAPIYNKLGYDLFLFDYRGYGKSEGEISNQNQFFADAQKAYEKLTLRYPEDKTIVFGNSLGTCVATKITAENSPKALVLQAPYYSLTDLVGKLHPYAPPFLLKYKFTTHAYMEQVKAPTLIFHGREDQLIYPASSQKLGKHNPEAKIILLDHQGHNGINYNEQYFRELNVFLSSLSL